VIFEGHMEKCTEVMWWYFFNFIHFALYVC